NGIPDNRLVLFGEIDTLGVAAAFDVEHGALAPAVFVVTDQVAALVGGQSRLTGTGEAEEQAGLAIFAHVGGAVHGQHVFLWQQEVLHGEHGLLHFAGVLHAGDQHTAAGEVKDDAAIAVGAVTLWHTGEVGRVDDFPFLLAGRIVLLREDKKVAAEQV